MTASLILLIVFFFRWYFSDTVKTHLWESVSFWANYDVDGDRDDYYDDFDVDYENDDHRMMVLLEGNHR